MKKILFLIALLLTACASNAPTLSAEMKASMQVRANQDAMIYPSDMNIVQMCVNKPIALYWNESIQTYAVVCDYSLPNVYGVVLVDANNVVLNTEHINAVNLQGLEDMIRSVGWENTQ